MVGNHKQDRISRRSFLKGATAAAVGATFSAPFIIPSSARGADGAVAPSNRITIASIGYGGMGTANTGVFLQLPGCQVVAVCDVDKGHRDEGQRTIEAAYSKETGQSYKGCATYNDFRELLARPDIDAVMIATPDHWHALIAAAAAKVGKDVYCEKPLGMTIAEGRFLSNTMKRYGRVFQTGSWQRSDSNFRFAAELVRNERIGKLQTIEVGLPNGPMIQEMQPVMPVPAGFDYDMWLGPAPWAPYTEKRCHFNFRWHFDYSGGMVTDWGVHHCDIAQWAMGMDGSGPVEIEGSADFPRDAFTETATDFRFVCTYANGVKMTVTNKAENGVMFRGSEGWLFVSRERIDASPKSMLTTVIKPSEIRLYRTNGHHQNFLECIRSRAVTVTPAEVAHRSATICHLGNVATRLGRKIQWNPETEQFVNDAEANRMISRAMRSPWQL